MLCPNCKTEIPEGKMYCPSCGHAIQIVPDFEPDLEEKIEIKPEAIEDIMADAEGAEAPSVPGGETKEIDTKDQKDSALERIEKRQKQRAARKISVGVKIVSFIVIAAAASVLFIVVRSRLQDRYSKHIKAAVAFMAQEDYEGAYDEYIRASQKQDITQESYEQALLGAANAAFLNGDDDEALKILNLVLEKDPESTDAYEQMIAIYEAEDDILSINNLISSCPVSAIYEKYKEYIILPPEFSQGGGEYEEDVAIELEATDGVSDIFYTIDGSLPDENSSKYTGPIVLTEGSYIISAVCRNKRGYLSPVVSEEFTIAYTKPESPSVKPDEGKKSEPLNITAEAPEGCVIFYTTDDTAPSEESIRYEGEIPMPMGKSTFRFVSIDDKGRVSDETKVSYNLNMAAAFSPQDGINYLVLTLFNSGVLADLEGHAKGEDAVYSFDCKSCYSSGSRIYYMLNEYVTRNGNKESTGNIYALDFKTLELYRAKRGEDGNFTFEMYVPGA